VVERDRLADATTAEDAERLAGENVEADVVEDFVRTESLGDVFELDVGLAAVLMRVFADSLGDGTATVLSAIRAGGLGWS